MDVNVLWCEQALVGDTTHAGVAVSVQGGRIVAIAAGVVPPTGARRLGGLTVPGLANAHSHAFHRALRSRTQRGTGSFWTWRDQMYLAAERLDPIRYHRLARAVFAEMASAGVAVVGEFHYVHHQPDGRPYADPNAMSEALVAAATEAGIRITLLDTLYLHGGLGPAGHAAPGAGQRRFADVSAPSWAERLESFPAGPRHRVGAAVHSVRAVDPPAMALVAEWAAAHDAPVHAHVSEQLAENQQCARAHGASPTVVLDRAGAVGPRFVAVHATHASHADVALLAARGAGVCLCPTTERDLADGVGPTGVLADAGVDLCLGSDSHAVIDLFEEARAVEHGRRLESRRRGTHQALDLLTMATRAGHRALGWHDAGILEVGARADLVTVDLASVRTAGAGHLAVEAVVFAATAADVTDVMVDGEVVVADRRHISIDVAAELDAAISELMEP